MSKKLIALLMAAMMLLSVAAACGNDAPEETPTKPVETPTTPAETPTTPAPTQPVDPDAEKYGGDLIVGESNVSSGMDLHQVGTSLGNSRWMNNIYEPLATWDANGKKYGMICDYEESEDGLTYTFTLRDRHFSNGKKITMEDVEASLRRAIALGVTTEATYNKNFKGATWTFTEDKLVVTFEELNIFFSTVMCSYGSVYKIMPKEICEKYPFTGGTETAEGFVWGAEAPMINEVEDVIGSGPYTLTKWNGESEIVLTRNENYDIITEGNEDAIGLAAPQKAYCDTITFAINADAASRTAAMMAKEYHVALIQDSMVEAANAMGIIGENDGSTWTYSIFFNLHESNADSPVADVNVRKAIRAAIDCNAAMLAVTGGNQDRVHMDPYPMVKSNTVYANTIFEDCGEWNIHDVELAKKYLAQSNYNGEPIVYLTPSSGNVYNVAMAIIPQLEAIGLNIELKIVDSGSHTAMRKDPATGHDIGGWIVGQNETAPTHTSYVTGTAAGWWTNDVKTEALKELETNPIGSEKSVAAYKSILQAVADEVPYIVMGRADTYLYRWPEVVTDFNGSTIYYWNSYFVK